MTGIDLQHVLRLWKSGYDTTDIRLIFGVDEDVIYNALARNKGRTVPAGVNPFAPPPKLLPYAGKAR